jgi:hypothetical protein
VRGAHQWLPTKQVSGSTAGVVLWLSDLCSDNSSAGCTELGEEDKPLCCALLLLTRLNLPTCNFLKASVRQERRGPVLLGRAAAADRSTLCLGRYASATFPVRSVLK